MSRYAKKPFVHEEDRTTYDEEEEYEYESESDEEIEDEASDNDGPEEEPEDFEPEVPEYSEELVRDSKTGKVYVAIVNHRGETINYYPVKAAPKGKAFGQVSQLVSEQRAKKAAPKKQKVQPSAADVALAQQNGVPLAQ